MLSSEKVLTESWLKSELGEVLWAVCKTPSFSHCPDKNNCCWSQISFAKLGIYIYVAFNHIFINIVQGLIYNIFECYKDSNTKIFFTYADDNINVTIMLL